MADRLQDWTTRAGQRQAVTQRALETAALDDARFYGALASFTASPDGQIILENLVQRYLLLYTPKTPEDVGELRFVQRFLQECRRAVAQREAPEPRQYQWPAPGTWPAMTGEP